MNLSPKQKEYWLNANHRWNVKTGATRSGKTYLDYFIIAKRLRAIHGKDGMRLFLGNTRATLDRNVFEPMRNIFGDKLVGNIRGDNSIWIFGEKCVAIGADSKDQVNRIRGMSVAYCYGDEVATWNEEVFTMLKSRLDKPYSCFDGTCNPQEPSHWFKKFLDSGADIYQQHYTIDDNPFLPQEFVDNLKLEYRGTVYYDRYILGLWCHAEGLLFPQFADNPKKWECKKLPRFGMINVGIDIGGTKSHSTMVATGITPDYQKIVSFAENIIHHSKGTIDAKRLCDETVTFLRSLYDIGFLVKYIFVDNAEQVILNSIRKAVYMAGFKTEVLDCKKIKGKDRILLYNMMLNREKMFFQAVPTVVESLSTALFDDSKQEDTILDDFTTDIDTFDAHFYSWSYFMDVISVRS